MLAFRVCVNMHHRTQLWGMTGERPDTLGGLLVGAPVHCNVEYLGMLAFRECVHMHHRTQ